MNKFLLFFCLLWSLIPSVTFSASPYFEWEVLVTEHFEIIYHKPQKELATQYAFAAEESYRLLAPVFSDLPQKTVVALDDSTDLTNGSATFLPYNWISIYPALPNSGESLDEYGFWPTSIMIHELTHIANFQPVSGFYTPFTYIFGRVVTPNTLLPRWYLEGLAVDTESRYTSFGRLRTSRAQGMLRAITKGQSFNNFGVDQINEVSSHTWPYGERPYFFGSLLQKSLVDQGDPTLREKWNQHYGRRVPFLIDGVPSETFEKDFSTLLEETYAGIESKANAQLDEIKQDGEFKPIDYQPVEHEQFEPTISPDGRKLIYISRSFRRNSIYLLEKKNELDSFSTLKPKLLLNAGSPLKLEWSKDSLSFYFDEIDMDSPFVSHRKIYKYEFAKKKKILVTQKLRAQEPALSPSGDFLSFIGTHENGKRYLGLYSLSEKTAKILYEAPLLERPSRPVFQDEDQILFAHRNLKGEDFILAYRISDQSVSKKTLALSNLRLPQVFEDRLYVLSNQSGIDNLFELKSETNVAKTNTDTWIHSYFHPQDKYPLVISQMTSKGLRLFEVANHEYNLNPKKPLTEFTDRPNENLLTEESRSTLIKSERSFYPFKYLVPTYWIPFVYPLDGGVIVQGSTGGSDPVGINQYVLSGSYDTLTSGTSYGAAYLNNSFPVSIGAFASQFQEFLGASSANFEKTNFGGTFSLPLSQRVLLGSGYASSTSTLGTDRDQREGPQASFNYSSLLDRRYSEFGNLFSLSYQKFLKGRDRVDYERVAFAMGQKASLPFKGDQSIWLGVKGAFSNNLPIGDVLNFGDRSLGANYLVNLTESQFLYRGYPSGSLVGRQLLNGNLEYRFPVSDIFRGNGTLPYFYRSLTGVAFVDAMSVDGAYFDLKNKIDPAYRRVGISDIHTSTGAELRLDTTLAYHLPITFILGGYYGMSRQMGENFSLFIGIGGQDPLSEVTHRHFP